MHYQGRQTDRLGDRALLSMRQIQRVQGNRLRQTQSEKKAQGPQGTPDP